MNFLCQITNPQIPDENPTIAYNNQSYSLNKLESKDLSIIYEIFQGLSDRNDPILLKESVKKFAAKRLVQYLKESSIDNGIQILKTIFTGLNLLTIIPEENIRDYSTAFLNDIQTPLMELYLESFTIAELVELMGFYTSDLCDTFKELENTAFPLCVQFFSEELQKIEVKIENDIFPEEEKIPISDDEHFQLTLALFTRASSRMDREVIQSLKIKYYTLDEEKIARIYDHLKNSALNRTASEICQTLTKESIQEMINFLDTELGSKYNEFATNYIALLHELEMENAERYMKILFFNNYSFGKT